MSLSDKIGVAALVVGAVTLFVAFAALVVAIRTLSRSNRNASAGTVVALNVAFRDAWDRYFAAVNKSDARDKRIALGDLANLMELACGMIHERTLEGVSDDIETDYLSSILAFFERDDLRAELLALQHTDTTFQYIRAFVRHPSRSAAHPKLISALAATSVLNHQRGKRRASKVTQVS